MNDRLVPFGYKSAWIAVRIVDPFVVAEALGLDGAAPVACRDAISRSYEGRVAVLPALPGVGGSWVLATSQELFDVDVVALSRGLDTEVQHFSTHRVSEAHTWARADRGELLRSFGYLGESGEITDWRGEPTPVESTMGLRTAQDAGELAVDEEDVMRVAAAWSLDPAALDGPAPAAVLLGNPPHTSGTGRRPARRGWRRMFGSGH